MSLQYLQAAPTQRATTTNNAIPLLQLTSKRSQLLSTSYYSFVLSSPRYYQLHQLHPTTYYLPLLTTHYYQLLPTIYLPTTTFSFSFFLSTTKNLLHFTTIYYLPTTYLLPTYYLPTYYLLLFLYRFAPLLPAALLTTHNYYYLPTTPKLSYPSTFFHF